MKRQYDVVIIGSGPAGMAAAVSACDKGASVCLVEREELMGGILKQCIHDGFGLIRFNEKLTGPEYAWRYRQMVIERDIDFLNLTFLTAIEKSDNTYTLRFVNPENGVFELAAGALVMAMGCRERSDRQIFLHGTRPAGIFTAGQAQDFINLKGFMPGKRSVILGSGDIGLIMARRLTLEGAKVLGVWELDSNPSGLTRNIVQCLEDYDIPLHLNSTVTEVHGEERLEAVTICGVDENKRPLPETAVLIECDSLILSVGLIPENDILGPLGIEMDPVTRGPVVDQNMQSSLPGIYSCGNALHVSDLVDYVSESGHIAGFAAAERALGRGERGVLLDVERNSALAYIVPQKIAITSGDEQDMKFPVFFRPSKPAEKAELFVRQNDRIIFNKKLRWLKPSEMHRLEIDFSGIDEDGLSFELVMEASNA